MGNPINKDTFLSRAKARFGENYDYSSILYKSYKTPVKIRCTKHPVKEISITPERHLQTTGGCKYCLREKRIRILERKLSMPDAQPPAPPRRRNLQPSRQLRPRLGPQQSPSCLRWDGTEFFPLRTTAGTRPSGGRLAGPIGGP